MEWRAPRLTKKVLGIEHCLQQIANKRQQDLYNQNKSCNGVHAAQMDLLNNEIT